MSKKIKYLIFLPALITPIIGYRMNVQEAVFTAIISTLSAAALIHIISKLIRKNVGAFVAPINGGVRLVFWNGNICRRVSTHTPDGRGLLVRAPKGIVFDEVTAITSAKVDESNFSHSTIICDNELTLIIDDLPSQSLVEFNIRFSSAAKESVLLKSELLECPDRIIREALNIDFWKPKRIEHKGYPPPQPKVSLICDSKRLNFSKYHFRKNEIIASWIFAVAAIAGELLFIAGLTMATSQGNANMDFIGWSFISMIMGMWGVTYVKNMPMFVRREMKNSIADNFSKSS